jgi:cytochrome c biogenesis protein
MRTALLLLLLLAVAAVPGSLLPQRNLAPEDVRAYLAQHPAIGPWLARLGLFDVYASPWFSAIYLLLLVSLVGCLVPRLRQHVANLIAKPPPAPARFERLPHSATNLARDDDPDTVATELTAALRRRRWRVVRRRPDDATVTIAAEKGYLKETGNVVFHFAVLALLVGVAWGAWYGWHGNRLVVADGYGFCNTPQQFDEYAFGPRTGAGALPKFCLELKDFRAEYIDNGQPVRFVADMSYVEGAAGSPQTARVEVNEPLRLDGATVYLLGHGYAPVLRYTDARGTTHTTVAPFLPDDGMLTSLGVATFPGANVDPGGEPAQVGFAGIYLPTAPEDPEAEQSAFPAERDPALKLVAYKGDLGLRAGDIQNVYDLSQRQIDLGLLREIGATTLRPGQSWDLPDGSRVEFLGTRQWVTVSVRHDPGQGIVLGGAVALLLGLVASLAGRRRRVWVRIGPADGGGSLISLGGLTRTEYPGFAEEFAGVVALAGAEERAAVPVGGRDTDG